MAPIAPVQKRLAEQRQNLWKTAARKVCRENKSASVLKGMVNEDAIRQDFDDVYDVLELRPEARDIENVRKAMTSWLEGLSVYGLSLAPEVQVAPDVMLEVFRRGKLATCVKNQVIQEENEEVKFFSIIFFGQCQVRMRGTPDSHDNRKESLIKIESLAQGESLGLFPQGLMKSTVSVASVGKTTLLQLDRHDYEALIRPYHQSYFTDVARFLQENRICQGARPSQLVRLAQGIRLRSFAPGHLLFRSGEHQRHVWILKSGECTVSVLDSAEAPTGVVPSGEEEWEEEMHEMEDFDRLYLHRLNNALSDVPAHQQTAVACEQAHCRAVQQLAHGQLQKTLEPDSPQRFPGRKAFTSKLLSTITVHRPGFVLGEEVFVHSSSDDSKVSSSTSGLSCTISSKLGQGATHTSFAKARYSYTVKTVQRSSFYVLDITSFKQFGQMLDVKSLTQLVKEKLEMRMALASRGKTLVKEVNREAQQLHAHELAKMHHRKVMLPPCVGKPETEEIADPDKFLDLVFDHREAPVDFVNLPTLQCLEGLEYGPTHSNNGPATNALLKAAKEHTHNKRRHPVAMSASQSVLYKDENPLGAIVPRDARYIETAPRSSNASLFEEAALFSGSQPGTRPSTGVSGSSNSQSVGGGLANLSQRFTGQAGDERPPSRSTLTSHGSDRPHSRSAATLPSMAKPGSAVSSSASTPDLLASRSALDTKGDTSSRAKSAASQPLAPKRVKIVNNMFNKVVVGKSILVLTDRAEVRKSITHALPPHDITLTFVKTSNDLLLRLRDPKDNYAILLIDLSKRELRIEQVLQIIRQSERYGLLPIVAISAQDEVQDEVRESCSYAIFLPISTAVLREALVYCLDRRSVEKLGNAA